MEFLSFIVFVTLLVAGVTIKSESPPDMNKKALPDVHACQIQQKTGQTVWFWSTTCHSVKRSTTDATIR